MPEGFEFEGVEDAVELSRSIRESNISPDMVTERASKIQERINSDIQKQAEGKVSCEVRVVETGGFNSVEMSLFSSSGEKIPLTVESKGKVLQLADAIKDPAVDPKEIADSVAEKFSKAGLSLPESFKDNFEKTVKDNPVRASVEDIAKYTDSAGQFTEISNIGEEIKAEESKASPDPQIIEQLKKQLVDKISAEVKEKVSRAAEEYNKLDEKQKKEVIDKAKEKGGGLLDYAKFMALIAAGYLTYEALEGLRKSMSGCWKYSSGGKKCKQPSLTCDSDYASKGSLCDSEETCRADVDPAKPSQQCDAKCATDCQAGKFCNDSGLCSKFCSCSYLNCNQKGSTVTFQCIDASIGDVVQNAASSAADIIDNIVTQGSSLLNTVLNWMKYAGIGLVVIIALFILYKTWQFLFSSKEGDSSSGHPKTGTFY